ncbi:MAG: DNA mismatch repair protein MutL, partial [Bacilli bacterium]|nr:DNA mismatch repair protein MutL [Bacilli bacterium]
VHGTYVIAENEDGMFLIDQHAANERINYEYYLEQLSNPSPAQMDLLFPITLEFPTNEYLILKENFELLTKMGFAFEEFGLQTIAIRTVPIWLPKGNEERAIQKIIEIIIEKESFDMERFVHRVAATVACKASIKANDHITKDDMEVLLERLRNCENPFTCPHGRPTIITYSKYDLEKLFKRSM